ncbi:Nop14-like protein [Cystobasidium minutum MCA 4210]|uniref:Nop14-like protein n=1 Tax=Cystobasidium minutum MCA 4210 TaxID=1397322 RepID=UPI0034CF69BA|eukprot:jgi/Rhomi1/189137/estExt_fgenesh1_pg.C_3_t20095
MGGSQLSQLKAALHSSGVTGQRQGGKGSKKKHGGSRKGGGMVDEDARRKKLEAIRESLNKFDVKTTKTKHTVLGAKPAKGSTGRPGLSKQAGIENRKKTLLPQWLDRNRTGAIVDRRFGEDDPTMTPEEKALQRFTFERQRKASKSSLFNLGDNEDAGSGTLLTHYGQNLDDVRGALADQEDLFQKSVTTRHIPELAEPTPDADSSSRKRRSKAEIMEEVIAKSKAYKYERQKEKHADEEIRLSLDDDLASIRGLLGAPNRREHPSRTRLREGSPENATVSTNNERTQEEETPAASTSSSLLTFVKPSGDDGTVDKSLLASLIGEDGEEEKEAVGDTATSSEPAAPASRPNVDQVLAGLPRLAKDDDDDDESDPYDRFVRELAFEKRAAPSDRLKSEAEAALEAAEALRRSEAARLKRMRGEDSDDNDEDQTDSRRKGKKGKSDSRLPQGDDLDDDYAIEGDEVGGFALGLGAGLQANAGENEDDEEDQEAGSHESEDESEDEGSENGDSDQSDTESEVSAGDHAETEMLADLLHRDAEARGLSDAEDGADEAGSKATSLITSKKRKGKLPQSTLPYTFPCPEDHDQFLDLISGHEDEVPTAVERIRTLYHPSLAEGNKQKLANFLGVLIDHVVYEASDSAHPRHLQFLCQQISSMSQQFPISSATFFVAKLKIMQRNLLLGLQAGPSLPTSRTWPGAGEVMLLRLAGLVWSASDFAHPVTTAAALLIAQYLAQCRVRNIIDMAAGLFLCSISTQYETFSKRLVPEVVNFLSRQLPVVVLGEDGLSQLSGTVQTSKTAPATQPDIISVLADGKVAKGGREQLSSNALSLAAETYSRLTSLPSFEECFSPLARSLDRILAELPSSALKERASTVKAGLDRAMKLARAARRPLALQSHKPVPIPTFIPKFDAGYAPGRKFDPDSARNEEAKLKALVKKERKGAIRELRKDSRFLAGERAKMQAEKDREYKSKIDKITAGLQEERHEEKRFERTKEREKMRDKKQSGGGRRK